MALAHKGYSVCSYKLLQCKVNYFVAAIMADLGK